MKTSKRAKTSKKPEAKRHSRKQPRRPPAKKPLVRRVIRKPQGHPLARVLSHAARLLEDLPKGLAVAAAVSAGLTSDRKWPPNDLNRTMDSYHYNVNSLDNFLVDVGHRLLAMQPSYVFTFDAAFVAASLPLTVAALTGSIDDNTTDAAS